MSVPWSSDTAAELAPAPTESVQTPTRSEVWLASVAIGALLAAVLCIGLAASMSAFAGHAPAPVAAPATPPARSHHVGQMAACLDAVRDENALMTCLKQVEAEAQLPASD